MKIALIGDVHANLHALQAVLDHARGQGVEAIWNVGDYVGYGAYPDEVVRTLMKVQTVGIIGNYDLKVLRFPKKSRKWRRTKRPEMYQAFQWASERLSTKSRKFLRRLPQERLLERLGWQVLLTHGSPASNEEPLLPDTPEARLQELAAMTEARVVACGHSHRGFLRQAAGVYFANCGSVGRPDDGDPRAAFTVLRLAPNRVEADHQRVAYDVPAAVEAIRRHNQPEIFAQMLLQGRDYATIAAQMGPAGRP